MYFDGFSYKPSALPLFFLIILQAFSAESKACPPAPPLDAPSFSRISFDYLIIGGGTAGLALASRLSEKRNLVVGVLEAGIFHQDDALIDVPANSGLAIGNATYDWNFVTAPQPALGGRSVPTARGKMLGGSSGLNLMAWTRPSIAELDALDSFAPGSGWNWKGLLPYFIKSENVLSNQNNPFPGVAKVQKTNPAFEGQSGPVQASLNVIYPDITDQYVQTYNALGIKTNPTPANGASTGISNAHLAIDRTSGTRSYAATAYYCSSNTRTNLHVLMGAQATKVTFKPKAPATAALTAGGVEFVVGSKTYSAKASREVILAAGTVQTPQLLELSGIGNMNVLKQAGIAPLLNIAGVGENLQEHFFSIVQFLLKGGHQTFDQFRNNATFAAEQAAQYAASRTGWLAASDSAVGFLPLTDIVKPAKFQSMVAAFDAVVAQPGHTPLQLKQYGIQRDWLLKSTVPQIETIKLTKGLIAPAAGESYMTILMGSQHPLCRGSVHIGSSNPLTPPVIVGNYIDNAFDQSVLVEAVKFVGNQMTITAMASIAQSITSPPSFANDADTLNYVKATLSTGSHLVGTSAMAPFNLGGVVNGDLKVYNTTNLRVVDASIIPIQLATHTQTVVYAIAEKAADIILKDCH